MGVSLTRREENKGERRRETPSPKPIMSPKKKISVMERIKAFKRKYRNQRNEKERKERSEKEVTKEKLKVKREKKAAEESQEDESDSITKMLKLISADINEIKGELQTNNEKMDNMSKKITKLELKSKENEKI